MDNIFPINRIWARVGFMRFNPLKIHFKRYFKRSDFRSRGLGIKARHERCDKWWRPHLENSRQYIRDLAPRSGRVAVFGAGRLLDLDLGHLLSRCETVELFDADPGAVAVWRREAGRLYGRKVIGRQVDITECLDEWSRGLPQARKSGCVSSYLRSLKAPIPKWSRDNFDGFISLNILGQIPLYWRDRANINEVEEEPALLESMAALQEAHLNGLLTASHAWSILLTDSEYYFYHVDKSHWRIEPALFGRSAELLSAEFSSKDDLAWLWHIAPQFVESDSEGEIHRVEARFKGKKR